MYSLKLRDSSPAGVWVRPDWLEGTLLYLDLDDEFQIQLSKEIQTLTDINKITVETTIDTSLPATAKNLAILRPAMDVEQIDNTYPDYEVDVEVGHRTLVQNKLRVNGYDKSENRIEISLLDSDDHWIVKIKEIYLDQLNLGTFTYTRVNVSDNWINKAKFIDGDPGYYFGHCFYGRYAIPKTFTLHDCRPLMHAKKMFDSIFSQAGWAVSVPLLETEYGRRIVHYLNKKEFFSDEEAKKLREFHATFSAFKKLSIPQKDEWREEVLKFPDEIKDFGNNYEPSTGIYEGHVYAEFIVELDYEYRMRRNGLFDTSASKVQFELIHEYDGNKIIADSWFTILERDRVLNQAREQVVLRANLLVKPGDKVYVEYGRGGDDIAYSQLQPGSKFYCIPQYTIPTDGDVIDIADNLRHDSSLDYLKGMAHLFRFMIHTDWSNNTVYFLTPFDVDFFGDTIGGYFNAALKDIRPKQVMDTERYNQLERLAKNRIYAFKKSSDAKIKYYQDKGWNEYEPFSRLIDNGFDIKDPDQNEVFENPYFEASLSADTGLEFNGGIIEAPWLVDNLDGNLSFDIAPRVMIAHGYTPVYYDKQFYVNGGNASGAQIAKFALFQKYIPQTALAINLPLVAQVQNQATAITGVFPNQVYSIPAAKIAYGWYSDDLYQLIHARADRENRDVPSMLIKVLINPEDYMSEAFRNRALITSPNIHTGDLMGRLTKLSGYDPKTNEAEYTFLPDAQVMDDCIGFDVPQSCSNYPFLKISKAGTVHTITVEGNINSPILSTVIQYRYENVGSWTVGSTVTTPTRNVLVQAVITFSDGCPAITLNRKIIVVLEPEVTTTKVGNKVTLAESGTHEVAISKTEIFASYDDVNYFLYQNEIDIEDATSNFLYIRAEVTYTSGEIRIANDIIKIAPTGDDCPNPDLQQYPPIVIHAKQSKPEVGSVAAGYMLFKSGEYNGEAAIDEIQFREKNKNQEWIPYSNGTLLSLMKCWEYRRVIIWCGDGCPPYCSTVASTPCGDDTGPILTINNTSSSETCSHTQKWEHPDTPAATNWKVEPLVDKTYHIPRLKSFIERDCGGVITEDKIKTIIWDRWNFRTEFVHTWNVGGTINSIEVSEAIGGAIGTQHTIPIDITYSSGDSNDLLATAIRERIETFLNDQGFLENDNFLLYISITGSATKTLNLGFVARHQPVNTWIGANLGVDAMDTSTGTVTATAKEFQLVSTSQPVLDHQSAYGTQFKVRFKVSTINYFLDDAASNFNNLVANATSPITTDTLSTGLTDTGKKFTLGASFTGCGGTATWIWLYGGSKKGESGKVISYTDSATIYADREIEISIIGKCNFANQTNYEKRIKLTP